MNEVLKAGKIEVRCISIERLTDVDIRHLEILHTEVSLICIPVFLFILRVFIASFPCLLDVQPREPALRSSYRTRGGYSHAYRILNKTMNRNKKDQLIHALFQPNPVSSLIDIFRSNDGAHVYKSN